METGGISLEKRKNKNASEERISPHCVSKLHLFVGEWMRLSIERVIRMSGKEVFVLRNKLTQICMKTFYQDLSASMFKKCFLFHDIFGNNWH